MSKSEKVFQLIALAWTYEWDSQKLCLIKGYGLWFFVDAHKRLIKESNQIESDTLLETIKEKIKNYDTGYEEAQEYINGLETF